MTGDETFDIEVFHSNNRVFTTYAPLTPPRVRTEVKDWLAENVPSGYSTARAVGEVNKKSLLKLPVFGLTFKFKKAEDALLFKMTWGGK